MASYTYTEEQENAIREHFGDADSIPYVDVEVFQREVFTDYPVRSLTAKLRQLDYTVEKKEAGAPAFTEAETEQLRNFLEENSGQYTAAEISDKVFSGEKTAKQITGKALSLKLTGNIRPVEKKETPKSFSEEQEATVSDMAEAGAFIEDIADAVNKTVPQVRGKLLSLKLTAPTKNKKSSAKEDRYAGIEEVCSDLTVEELVAYFNNKSEGEGDFTARGVKTVLTRRKLVAKDYAPKSTKE